MAKPIKIVKKMGIFAPDVTVDIEVTEGDEDDLPRRPMRLRKLTNVGQDRWEATYDFPMGSGHSLPKPVTVVGNHIEFKPED
jgi:hypothetical protein